MREVFVTTYNVNILLANGTVSTGCRGDSRKLSGGSSSDIVHVGTTAFILCARADHAHYVTHAH